MIKKFIQKIKQNHLLLMIICCLVPMVLIIVFFSLFKGNGNYWTWLIMLLCPLLHILMMKGHNNHDSCQEKKDKIVK